MKTTINVHASGTAMSGAGCGQIDLGSGWSLSPIGDAIAINVHVYDAEEAELIAAQFLAAGQALRVQKAANDQVAALATAGGGA